MATTAETALTSLTATFQKFMKDHHDEMEKVIDRFDSKKGLFNSKSNRDLARRQKMREIELKQVEKGVKAMERLDDAMLELESSLEKNSESSDTVRESATQLAHALDSLMKDSVTASKEQREVILNAKVALQQGNLTGALSGITQVSKDLGEQETKRFRQQEAMVKTGDLYDRQMRSLTETVKANMKQFFSLNTAIGLAVSGLSREFGILQKSLEHQVPAMDLVGGHFKDSAAMYGLSVQSLMETQTKYAQAMEASAGSVDSMADVSKRFMDVNAQLRQSTYNLTGDLDKGAELLATAMDAETLQGVHMGMADISAEISKPKGLLKNLQEMSMMTGKSAQELLEMNKAMMNDNDFRTSMLGLNRKERSARLNELVTIQDGLIKRGMETSQAVEATQALQKLTAQMSPKDRFKETMKLSVMARAMGVKGAEQLPSLMQDPVKNAQAISTIMSNIQQRQGSMMAPGNNLGVQQLGYMMGQVGGQTQQTLARLSTGGMEGKALDQHTQDQIAATADKQLNQLTGLQSTALDIKKAMERLTKWLDDPGVALVGGTIAALGSVFKTAAELMIAKQLIGGSGGALAGGLMGKVGSLGTKLLPGLATGGMWAGGAALAGGAGYALGTGIDKAPELFGGQDISSHVADALEYLFPHKQDIMPILQQHKASLAQQDAGPTITSSSQNQDPTTLVQNQIDALNRLSDNLASHTDVTDDMKDAIKNHVATMKASVDATKNNTEATKNNTTMTQTTDRQGSMSQADPASGG